MKVSWKGATLLAPLPSVLVSCGGKEDSNLITVAWTGIINSQPPKTYISLRESRYSYDLIKSNGEFVINLTTSDMVFATDFCGVKSGRDIDKFKACNLTAENSKVVTCKSIKESPLNIECRVFNIMPLGSHTMFMADIVAINVDDRYIDTKGKLNLDKCNLMAYNHGEYFSLGKKLGKFGFSVKKKK